MTSVRTLSSAVAVALTTTLLASTALAQSGVGDSPGLDGQAASQDPIASWQQDHPPASEAERAESAEAYEDMSTGASLDLARQQFPSYFDGMGASALAEPGDEVQRYLDDYTAVVDPAGDADPQLAVSSMPLRVAEPSGGKEPVDPELHLTPGGYKPAAIGTRLIVPEDLEEGIQVGQQGVTLSTENSGSDPRLVADRAGVFYSDVATDTDLIVSPITGGFRFALQLRSAASPDRIVLPLDLPGSSSLRIDSHGFAEIDTPGGEDFSITPPVAADADGIPVQSSFETDGDALILNVEADETQPHYPILVDPTVVGENLVSDDFFESNADPGSTGWHYFEGMRPGTNDPSLPYYSSRSNWGTAAGYGLGTTIDAGRSLAGARLGQWYERVPNYPSTSAYFNYVQFRDPSLLAGSSPAYPYLEYGIFKPQDNTWATSHFSNGTTGTARNYYTANFTEPSFWMGPTNDAGAKEVDFQLNSATGVGSTQWRSGFLGGITTYIADLEWPTTSSGSLSQAPAQWTDSSVSVAASVAGSDGGLGVQRTQAQAGPSESSLTTLATRQAQIPDPAHPAQTIPCEGWNQVAACPQSYSDAGLNFNTSQLPEGADNVYVRVYDALNKYSAPRNVGTVRIDRSAPDIPTPTGSLQSDANNIASTGLYHLAVTATDGSSGSGALARSGVRSLKLLVDGDPQPVDGTDADTIATQSCSDPYGGCPNTLPASWTVDAEPLDDGAHTVVIEARDALNHLASRSFQITVRSDDEEPVVTAALSQSGQQVIAGATDGNAIGAAGPYGSGVTDAELMVDGETVDSQTFHQDCGTGGCPMPSQHAFNLPAGTDPTTQPVTLMTSDAAGNTTINELGHQNPQPFRYYGFNEDFVVDNGGLPGDYTAKVFDRAIQGNANQLRISVDWCGVEPNPPTTDANGQLQHNYVWPSVLDDFFERVKKINEDPNNDGVPDINPQIALHVLPNITGSPPWARRDEYMADGFRSVPAGNPDPLRRSPDGCGATGFTYHDGPGDAKAKSVNSYPPDADHVDGYGAFVAALLDRYGDALYGMDAVEVWNEPNLEDFWGSYDAPTITNPGADPGTQDNPSHWRGPDPALVGDLFDSVVASMTAAQRQRIDILTPAMSPINAEKAVVQTEDVLEQIQQRSAIDGIALHVYENRTSQVKEALTLARKYFRALMDIKDEDRFDLDGVKPWVTEIGFPGAHAPNPDGGRDLGGKSDGSRQRQKFLGAFSNFANSKRDVQAFIVHRLFYCRVSVTCNDSGALDLRGAFGIWGHDPYQESSDAPTTPKKVFCKLRDMTGTGIKKFRATPGACEDA